MSHEPPPAAAGPSLGRPVAAGVVVESWRLWEGLAVGDAFERVSDWRLDADYFLRRGGPVSVAVVVAQGSSMIADALERLAGSGARAVVRIGTTGGLQETQQVGEVVVPFCAVRGEGTSGHYLPGPVPAVADPELVRRLCASLGGTLGAAPRPSMVWTTDGRWCEEDHEILAYSELGVAAVDMESAALFASAYRRRVRAASVSLIVDLPVLHVGHAFKGLPGGPEEWDAVIERAREVFARVVAVLEEALREEGA